MKEFIITAIVALAAAKAKAEAEERYNNAKVIKKNKKNYN
jgi:hypothetical protein